MEQYEWEKLSPEQKKIQLYLEQKKTLEAFLERGAISKAQFDKSLGDLTVKMGMSGLAEQAWYNDRIQGWFLDQIKTDKHTEYFNEENEYSVIKESRKTL